MLKKIIISCLIILVVAQSCKTTHKTTSQAASQKPYNKIVPTLYHASNPIVNELVHTKLDIRFDWAKKYLYGKATITLKPHFYPTQTLALNARGMTINEVSMLSNNLRSPLIYAYRNDSLIINLDRTYKAGESYIVFIDYTAKPDELKAVGGSDAITSDKGLYFINPDGKDTAKPKQIWTQGETQSNSVWFPTIDAPDQKMTQEINITIDTAYVTLSNGLLTKSTDNGNGTRTDYWKQSLPHSPYLVMMAIGKFAIVKDKWRDKEVSYYVEPEYKNMARKIFGKTPEMIEFFSKRMGVDYAWDKYSQVVVRDYVSGAMENTSATLHGGFMQNDEREFLDYTGEDVISHELFHHWFGDLVTAESWSNIPLNESFATYGEYLWNEFKYGRDTADAGWFDDLNTYLREAKTKKANLVRYAYDEQEELFDRHTYQKGGCILHMLRKYVGDDAFFASLKLYLEQNKFRNAEVAQLRLAFEQVTGEDLNWFFNQWFFGSGYPLLDISYQWDAAKNEQHVIIEQKQDFETTQLFKLRMQVDIYANGKTSRQKIILDSARQEFVFPSAVKPDLVNVDAEKMLVCTKMDHHTNDEWIYMYHHAPLFMDRTEALQKISKTYTVASKESALMMEALNDKHPDLRRLAIKNIGTITSSSDSNLVKTKLADIAQHDKNSHVREEALQVLDKNFKGESSTAVIQSAIHDSSYLVMSSALKMLVERNEKQGLQIAREEEKQNNKHVYGVLEEIFAKYGNDSDAAFMQTALASADGFDKYQSVQSYGKFLMRCNNEDNISKGLDNIYNVSKNATVWFVRFSVLQTLTELSNRFGEKKDNKPMYESLKKKADELAADLKKNEKNENILKIIGH